MQIENLYKYIINSDSTKMIGAGVIVSATIAVPFAPSVALLPVAGVIGGYLTKKTIDQVHNQIFSGTPPLDISDPRSLQVANILCQFPSKERREFVNQLNQLNIPKDNRLDVAELFAGKTFQERTALVDLINSLKMSETERFRALELLLPLIDAERILLCEQINTLQIPDTERFKAFERLLPLTSKIRTFLVSGGERFKILELLSRFSNEQIIDVYMQVVGLKIPDSHRLESLKELLQLKDEERDFIAMRQIKRRLRNMGSGFSKF